MVLALLTVDALLTISIVAGAATGKAAEQAPWKPELLPREREMAAALSAGPASIVDGAGVYLLTQKGFVLERPSRNGFHCLVARDLPGSFEPQCFDSEGSETLMQVTLLQTSLRMGGESPTTISRAVAEGYASGRLRAPRRPGIDYMLSRENRVPVDDKGAVAPYRPHVMICMPYLGNADVGGDARCGSPVFVINEHTPGACLIIPVPAETLHAHAGSP